MIIGALPGLTATMGLALMTTLTLSMPSHLALLVLVCTYVGAIYGGSRSAILQAESDEQVALMGAPHQLEAVRANLDKRAPVFANR